MIKPPPIEGLKQLLAEARQTLAEREAHYPQLVETGRLTLEEIERRLQAMRGIVLLINDAIAKAEKPGTHDTEGIDVCFASEVMLSNWSDTAAAGRKVEFWLPEDADAPDEHPFKHYSRRLRGAAGTRFQMVLVEIDEEGEPIPRVQPQAAPRLAQGGELVGGPVSKNAGMLCKDGYFHDWLYETGVINETERADPKACEALATEWVRKTCGVESRRMLDHDRNAQLAYENRVLHPYNLWLGPPA